MAVEEIRSIIIDENGASDPTGLQQDCLGMTPLHILSCSTVQRLELYQLMIEIYHENLIVKDAWGATPLLYAVWGAAPREIIDFLIDSYQSLYPDHEFDWTAMLITLGGANAPVDVIQNLLDLQQTLSPGYIINWDRIVEVLAERTTWEDPQVDPRTFCFLTRCSIAARVSAIGVKQFRDAMAYDWMGHRSTFRGQRWRDETLLELEYYESEYQKLIESTSLLELALWKMNIDASSTDNDVAMGDNNKL
jgi:hypothetical protein